MVRDNAVKTVHDSLFVESQSGEGWKGTPQATQSSPLPWAGALPPRAAFSEPFLMEQFRSLSLGYKY